MHVIHIEYDMDIINGLFLYFSMLQMWNLFNRIFWFLNTAVVQTLMLQNSQDIEQQ